MKYLYDPPGLLKNIFKEFNWNTVNGKILLTFDDGPLPETTQSILKILNKNNIRAIFFCVGGNVQKYPELVNEILAEGHTVGNHTFNHKILTKLTRDGIKKEISSFNDLVREKFNYNAEYFRPPHGKFDFAVKRILKEKNMKPVMWSLLTADYKNDLNLVKFAVDNYLKHNSIVVLHDSLKSKDIILNSIEYIIDKAGKMNFEIGEPSGCLR